MGPLPEHRSQVTALNARYGCTAALAIACFACGSGPLPSEEAGLPLGESRQAFINGPDDRLEYYELTDERTRAHGEASVVALTVSGLSRAIASGDTSGIQTWGQTDSLCDDEPFADQPAAVFCSGVLVDWDLVLTSGHCIDVVPLTELRVVFDYYYRQEGELAVSESSIHRVSDIVAAQDDGPASGRLDFAWLRLSEPARPPHRPAPIYTASPAVTEGDAILNIGSGGGVPFKFDAGGSVQDSRPEIADYFVADTDTSGGSSGSGAFDADFAVVGSLARGAPDFVLSDRGCNVSARSVDPADAIEEFTYAHRAVKALCDSGADTGLCSAECAEPCDASTAPPRAHFAAKNGCSLRAAPSPSGSLAAAVFGALSLLLLRRRRR